MNAKLSKFRDPKFTFGKYKGQSIKSRASSDPDYIVWAYINVAKHGGVSDAVYKQALSRAKKTDSSNDYGDDDYDEYGMQYDPYAAYGGFFDGTSYGD